MKPHERIKRIIALDVSPSLKAVLHILAFHADKQDRCYPSMGLIAKEIGISTRQARRTIRELEGHELVKTIKRDGRSSYYLLQLLPRTPMSYTPDTGVRHNSSHNLQDKAKALPNPNTIIQSKTSWAPIPPCTQCGKYLQAFGGFGKCPVCLDQAPPKRDPKAIAGSYTL